mgnify:CR=1 FL=1
MKSYIEQAIRNYVKPIIVNYHNHGSSTQEIEEIYSKWLASHNYGGWEIIR